MMSIKPLAYLLPVLLCSCALPTLITKRGSDIHWSGGFTPGDAEKFKRQVRPDTQRLIIRSPGGLADEALAVARLVQQHGLTVQVKDYCASACAFIFLAAPRRELPEKAFLAFHASLEEIAMRETHQEVAKLLHWGPLEVLQISDKFRSDLSAIFKRAGIAEVLYDKLVIMAGVIPGSVTVLSAEAKGNDNVSIKFHMQECGLKGWVPDEDGLRRIGASLSQPYIRPPKEQIARTLHLKVEQIAFQSIDDLTSVTCSPSESGRTRSVGRSPTGVPPAAAGIANQAQAVAPAEPPTEFRPTDHH